MATKHAKDMLGRSNKELHGGKSRSANLLTKALNTIKPQPGWRKGVTAKRM